TLYGMTEAPVTSYLPPRSLDVDAESRNRLMDSVGRALPGYELRIAGQLPHTPGEVLIRGGHVMAGYWQDETATRAALRNGWLHSGDIGRLDDAGNLHIVGRLHALIPSRSRSLRPK